MSVEKSQVIRPLGPLENFVSVHHLLKTALRTIVTGRYSVPDQVGDNLETCVKIAVALTVLDHPLLQPGLLDEDSKQPSWVRLASIDLDHMIDWVHVAAEDDENDDDDEFLQKQLVKLHNTPFTNLETVPGWHVTVLRRGGDGSSSSSSPPPEFIDVIFHYSHTNIDGMSGKIFHRTLRQKLSQVSSSSDLASLASSINLSFSSSSSSSSSSIFSLPTSSNLPPTQESLMTFPISPSFILSAGWKGLRPQLLTPRHFAHWAPINHTPGVANETTLRLLSVSAPRVKSLLSACRTHKTTMTGLLHALILVSLTRQGLNQDGGFVGGSTIDMRRFADADKKVELLVGVDNDNDVSGMMGNYVTLFGHTFDAALVAKIKAALLLPKDKEAAAAAELRNIIWETASGVRRELSTKLEQGTRDDLMGLVPYIAKGDLRGVLKGEMAKARECSWEVSNLGVLEGLDGEGQGQDEEDDDDDEWEIERLVSSQSAVANGAAVLVFPISVKGGEMCVTVSAQKGVVGEEVVSGVSEDLKEWLGRLGE